MFQKIVVPLDGSSRAARAVPIAARIARTSGGTIILLQVVPDPMDFAWQSLETPLDVANAIEVKHRSAAVYLRRVAASSDLQGAVVITEVVDGNPARTILSMARAHQANLIVMCSHGETGVKRWVLGSVAHKVARHSAIPVFILHPDTPAPAALFQGNPGPVRILVALDGSCLAEEALAPATILSAALSVPDEGALHLARILSLREPEINASKEKEQAMKKAQTYLAAVEGRMRHTEPEGSALFITTSLSLDADVASALVRLAETGEGGEQVKGFTGCDVIAMATHGRGGLARWIMGSVTERVLDITRLPMLIVRPQMTSKEEKGDSKQSSNRREWEEAEGQSWVGLF